MEKTDIIESVKCFLFGFNNRREDILRAVLHNDATIKEEGSGTFMNSAVFGFLSHKRDTQGIMTIASIDGKKDQNGDNFLVGVCGEDLYEFNISGGQVFILGLSVEKIADKKITPVEIETKCILENTPDIEKAEFFAPLVTMRFSVKVFFTDGSIKKYVLPTGIECEDEKNEVVIFRGQSFTNKIWANGKATPDGITFINKYFLSKTELFYLGRKFIEPTLCDKVFYKNEKIEIKQLAEWTGVHIDYYNDYNREYIRLRQDFNEGSQTILVNLDGSRATPLMFSRVGPFEDGAAKVTCSGCGLGYIDKDLQFVIPPGYKLFEYSTTEAFRTENDGDFLYFDRKGKKILTVPKYEYYMALGMYDGLIRVSDMNRNEFGRAVFSMVDMLDEVPGNYGYIDRNGNQVIKPQYIFAGDFDNGLAIVIKGKWENREHWYGYDGKDVGGGMWSDDIKWGVIDKTGKEVLPFIYDEIIPFDYSYSMKHNRKYDYFRAWNGDKWVILNKDGTKACEMEFEAVDYTMNDDGCFMFYSSNKWDSDDRDPKGIYSIKEQKILFDFQWADVEYCYDGNFIVEYKDEKTGNYFFKAIAPNGEEVDITKYDESWRKAIKQNGGGYIWQHDFKNVNYRGGIKKTGKIIKENHGKETVAPFGVTTA
ncbi:MAG: WG repeat-containing protein, partial [Christensenellaceae bacterium]|nr:WG repeat-containing protein [Christensenellaceae bacterium]